MPDNRDMELMKQVIARKQEKSAAQGSVRKGPQDLYGTSKTEKKKRKKEGSPAPDVTEPEDEA